MYVRTAVPRRDSMSHPSLARSVSSDSHRNRGPPRPPAMVNTAEAGPPPLTHGILTFISRKDNSHSYTHLILALGIVREPTIWGFITSKYIFDEK